jgi:tetratricopeptide (TPR) repeat protein
VRRLLLLLATAASTAAAQAPNAQPPADSGARAALMAAFAQATRGGRVPRMDDATTRAIGDALIAGRIPEALAAFRAGVERAGGAAYGDYVRTLATVGHDEQAEADARRWAADPARAPSVSTALGELLAARGALAEARAAYERAIAGRAEDSLTARVGLATLLDESGDRATARTQLRRVVAAQSSGDRLTEEQWLAVGDAQKLLAREETARYRLALQAYDRAAAERPADVEPKLRAGALFLEKYNAPEARKSFESVLRTNPREPRALLGLAKVLDADGASGAVALADSALKSNPRYVDAYLFVAAARLDAEDYPAAEASVRRALAVDSTSADALTVLGAVKFLQGDQAGLQAVTRQVLARDPKHAELYATLAELAARHRQYAGAARFAEQGVALDSTSWRSHALRGINQLRLGHVDSARASLEVAFKGDPFDVWTKNTLDLLDAAKSYRTSRTAHFDVVADSAEATLLSLYLGDLLERGYAEFAKRYAYTPPGRVRLELYRTHADFSVRSVGLTGLGALGVSFGPVLAMDAPSARAAGEFHWGATAWHELAHTFTLGVSNDRVPRWLSEGLSTLEERRARPGWGEGPTPGFLVAYAAGKVPPPSRLNDGFVRPEFPEQVLYSYYAASLLCELIERDFGPNAVNALLAAYKDGLSTPAAIQRALKVDLPTLDQRFDAYVKQRFEKSIPAAVGGPGGAYVARLDSSEALVGAQQADSALRVLERAKAIYPEFASGEDNAYWRIAAIREGKGDLKGAAAELGALTARNASHLPAQIKLATLRAQLGDTAGAAKALEESIWISPYEPTVHEQLAVFSAKLGDHAAEVRERRAVLALAPVDVAGAQYQLARALFDAGRRDEAKREVLRSLERAPTFAPAQELLLQLVGGAP